MDLTHDTGQGRRPRTDNFEVGERVLLFTGNEIRLSDFDLLAAEYERGGDRVGAERIRDFGYATTSDRHALRAIAAARRNSMPVEKLIAIASEMKMCRTDHAHAALCIEKWIKEIESLIQLDSDND